MSEEKEIIWANGFSFKRNEKSPEFVIGRMSIKVSDAVDFLGQHERDGWVNLDVKMSRAGKYYVELDQYVPQTAQEPQGNRHVKNPTPAPVIQDEEDSQVPGNEDDDLPF